MIVFSIISIVNAKKRSAWIYYVIGAVLQLLGLLGNQKTADFYGYNISIDWLIYFGLLIVFAVIVTKRKGTIQPDNYNAKIKCTAVKPTEDVAPTIPPAGTITDNKVESIEDPAKHPFSLVNSVAAEIVPEENCTLLGTLDNDYNTRVMEKCCILDKN